MNVATPTGWYSIPLRELIYDFERGISYTSAEISLPSDIKMVNLACIDKTGYYRDGELKDYTGPISAEMKVYPGDLLIACTDLTRNADIIGTPIIVPEGHPYYVYSTDLAKLIPNDKVDKDFLYYALKSPSYRKYIKPWASGTNVLHLNLKGVYDYTITLPSDIEEQRRIAQTLKSIDKKLNLNRLINDNLEAMAKQLYDYWFVQFEFPDKHGRPYKSSGGSLTWNENLKRMIPSSWNDCLLGDYIGRITNGLNPRKNFSLGRGNNYYVSIRSLIGTDIDWDNCERCDDEALAKINRRSQLKLHDVIFSAIGTIGRTYYIQEEPNNWNISETSFTLRAKEGIPSDFFYSLLRSDEIQVSADKSAMGSTLRCLVMESLCKIRTVYAEQSIMALYSSIVAPMFKSISSRNKNTRELLSQRDRLLTLLMNGQVRAN